MADREAAWDLIHGRLPSGWRVGPPAYRREAGRWEVVARPPSRGGRRAKPPDYVIGTGPDELVALRDPAERLARRS